MESRTITEYKVFILALSHVKGNVDNAIPVVVFDDKEKLRQWYESQREPWIDREGGADSFGQDHPYHKEFKKGSILEWYNPPHSLDSYDSFGGVREWWTDDLNFNIPFNPTN